MIGNIPGKLAYLATVKSDTDGAKIKKDLKQMDVSHNTAATLGMLGAGTVLAGKYKPTADAFISKQLANPNSNLAKASDLAKSGKAGAQTVLGKAKNYAGDAFKFVKNKLNSSFAGNAAYDSAKVTAKNIAGDGLKKGKAGLHKASAMGRLARKYLNRLPGPVKGIALALGGLAIAKGVYESGKAEGTYQANKRV